MRLTKFIREAFVRSAMSDVPSENFEEQAHKIIIDDSVEALPLKLRPFALDKNLCSYINMRSYWVYDSPFSSVSVFSERGRDFQLSMTAKKQLDVLIAKAKEQKANRKKLEESISAAANSVSTRKALVALLPEFEKYLPADEPAACKTLPAVANLVSDFTKAGWPKSADAPKAKKATAK